VDDDLVEGLLGGELGRVAGRVRHEGAHLLRYDGDGPDLAVVVEVLPTERGKKDSNLDSLM
jgi:hypothetical protein